jgi:hypothetical protein
MEQASLSGVLCYAVAYTSIFYYGATTYSLHYDWNMVYIQHQPITACTYSVHHGY